MVTIESLKKEIEKEKSKRSKIEEKFLEQEKIRDLQAELKELKKTPSQIRTGRLIKRTGRGLKFIGKKIGSAAIRQGKRIRAQQLRDFEAQAKKERIFKKSKKRKIKKTGGNSLGVLDGINIGF